MSLRAALVATGISWASVVSAATIEVFPVESGGALVVVDGQITPDDGAAFRSKIAPHSKAIVIFDSIGGSLIGGIEIGRTIRLRNFSTWVPSGSRCASACALAWLGGARRSMGKNALVGFHAAWRMEDAGPAVSGKANALMGKYLSDLGLSYEAVAYISSASPTSMTWLNSSDAARVGIDVAMFDPKDDATTTGARTSATATPSAVPAYRTVTGLRERAAEYLGTLYTTVSGPQAEALALLSRSYADTVEYYGKSLSRDEVLTQITRFVDRWPQRQYRPRENTVKIDCDQTALLCNVAGILDFDSKSPERNQRSVGAATFEYSFKFEASAATPKITREYGSVLGRVDKFDPVTSSGDE